jgi:hypothetical protein
MSSLGVPADVAVSFCMYLFWFWNVLMLIVRNYKDP